MSKTGWIEVTRNQPCSRCGSTTWCSRSSDRNFELCRRHNDGTGKTRADKNGDEYHIYYIGPRSEDSTAYRRIYRKPPKVDESLSEKYLYISSSRKGGASPGAPVHVPLIDHPIGECVRVTEGELKADIATARTGILTISVPGVATWNQVLPILRGIK